MKARAARWGPRLYPLLPLSCAVACWDVASRFELRIVVTMICLACAGWYSAYRTERARADRLRRRLDDRDEEPSAAELAAEAWIRAHSPAVREIRSPGVSARIWLN